MRLYSGLSPQFVDQATRGSIAGRLRQSFFRHFRFYPSPSEVQSWDHSLRSLSRVFTTADLTDHGVILEYQLPLTSRRLDCLICGRDEEAADNAVVIELKQWQGCQPADGESLVATWVGGGIRETLHPSAQVGQYHRYLEDTHTAFWEGEAPVSLSSCAFLHNYEPLLDDPLLAPKFDELLKRHPAFLAADFDSLVEFLRGRLVAGQGDPVLQRIEGGRYRPSKKLMDHVGQVIKGKSEFVLLDEQLVIYESVLATALRGTNQGRTAILVRGGPGTGKSVVAINLMSDLLLEGVNAHYATGSRAFTETLRDIIGSRGGSQFKYFNSYMDADPACVDVLICDEAHRIRETSNNRFTPRDRKSHRSQLEELLNVSRVSVFFIDDRQGVRPNEIGSSEFIRREAMTRGYEVREYHLEAQFRCAGSEGFVNWINNTLDVERTANVLWEPDEADFDLRILASPEDLEEAIHLRAGQGFSARLVAGFCWKWSKPRPDGTLVPDVQIGAFQRPWNAKPDAGRLAPGIPKSNLWAHRPEGIRQIGVVYTAQGFEFEYVGVIVGGDLVYDWEEQSWAGRREKSQDTAVKRSREQFVDLVKNVYRVLLSRGLKGCYVHFLDKDTEKFVRSRISGRLPGTEHLRSEVAEPRTELSDTIRLLTFREVDPFVNAVPLYELDAAAGGFGPERGVDSAVVPEEVDWVELPQGFAPKSDLFVCRVNGESMNRRIPDGALCLFRFVGGGSRQGKIVLAQLHGMTDVDTGGQYTVKRYRSRKRSVEEAHGEDWRHEEIVLEPDSTESRYEAIKLDKERTGEVLVLAELVAVLP